MKRILRLSLGAAFAVTMFGGAALAQGAGQGPVGVACKAEIEKFCAGMQHGQGEIRACLEKNKDQVGAECKKALETTGGGRR